MELESSYTLHDILRDDGIRTYRAIEITTGQELQVHLFTRPDAEPDRLLFRAIRALPVSRRRELLEIGMEGDMPYIVTEKLPDTSTAREWLMKFAGLPAKPVDSVILSGTWKTGTPLPEELKRVSHGPAVSPVVKTQVEMSPDYTRVMRVPLPASAPPPIATPPPVATLPPIAITPPIATAPPTVPPPPVVEPQPERPKPKEEPPPVQPPPPVKEPPSPVEPPAEETDEFSRLFGLAPTGPRTPPAMTPPAMTPPASQINEPGEFTRQFLAAKPVITPPVAENEPGEFTRQFLAAKPLLEPVVQKDLKEPVRELRPAAPIEPERPAQPPAIPFENEASAQQSTRLYEAVEPPPPPPTLQADAPPVVQPPPVQSSSDQPTLIFQAVTPSTPPAGKEPGEFTRMFPSSEPAPPPPVKEGPSEFTKFFQSPMHPAADSPRIAPQTSTPTPQQVSRTSKQPGEFTQMFGTPNQPPSAPPPPMAPAGSSSATGVFSLKPSPPRTQAPPSNGGASGPGEFTRMMAASAQPTLGQPQNAAKSAEPQNKSNVLLYVAVACVLLAIVLIVVFFVLRH